MEIEEGKAKLEENKKEYENSKIEAGRKIGRSNNKN